MNLAEFSLSGCYLIKRKNKKSVLGIALWRIFHSFKSSSYTQVQA